MADENQNDDNSNTGGDSGGAGDENSVEFLQAELERYKVKHGEEKKHRKTAETKVSEHEKAQREAKAEREALERKKLEDNAKNSSNEEDYKKSMQELRDNDRKTYEGQINQYKEALANVTSKQAAQDFVSEQFGKNAKAMLKNFEGRFVTELNGTEATVSILGLDGKPSAMTRADLIKEITDNSIYSPFRVVGNANGGGADGSSSKGNGGGAPKFKNATEEAQWANANPDAAQKLYGVA